MSSSDLAQIKATTHLVDARPSKEILERWLAEGFSLTRIALAADISRPTADSILSGRFGRCHRDSAAKVAGLTRDSLRAAGHPTTARVDAREAFARLRLYVDAGFSPAVVAASTGLTVQAVWNALDSNRVACERRTADALLAIHHEALFASAGDDMKVPSYGVRRRVEALGTLGWRFADIDTLAARLGIRPLGRTIEHVTQPSSTRSNVTARTHRDVASVYRRAWATTGPSRRTQQSALAQDWLSPGAWDDIDDPFERPLPQWARQS